MLIRDGRIQTLTALMNRRKLKDQDSDNVKTFLSFTAVKAQQLEWQILQKEVNNTVLSMSNNNQLYYYYLCLSIAYCSWSFLVTELEDFFGLSS